MSPIHVRCPAKVNTFLAVGPPDPSGYHPLRTVFQAVSLFDTLIVQDQEGDDVIVCDWADLPAENTMTKALRLAREFAPIRGLRIELRKRIPAQSGLGGGSSDAAGLLRALDVLYPGHLDARDKHDIAAAVGADVPFFLVGGRARGEGYGERLAPLPDSAPIWMVLTRPEVGVSTQEAYRRLDAAPREWRAFPEEGCPPFNDFEVVAPPECHAAKRRLVELGAQAACLCGSGSAVYGEFASEEESARAAAAVGTRAWVVRTLGRAESVGVSLQP